MSVIALGVALQIAVAPYAAMPGVESVPRDAVTDSLRSAASRFMMGWRREWMAGRHMPATYVRLASLHCHHDGTWKFGAPNIIRSKESSRSFCPTWFPLDDPLPGDEADGVDTSLRDDSRRRLRNARADLMRRFESAARAQPHNPWLMGQLVRLAVDQDEGVGALKALRDCAAGPPWCLLLEGYVNHSLGRLALADSLFWRAAAHMNLNERCEWTSIGTLLDSRARAAYERLDCAARDSADATYWWLADPLYIEPGNARRAAHFARKVLVVLHAGLTLDERWDWRPKYGGEALATMIVRYGWPSFNYWGGYREDNGHFAWLGFRDSAVNVAPEYALPRFTTTPPWRVVLDPSTLTAADWRRFAPRQGDGAVEWESDHWPSEHWARDGGPIVELPDQTVAFRRDTNALLAVAMDLPQRFFRPGVAIPYDAAIIAARDATDQWVASRTSVVLDGRGTTVLVSPLSMHAQIVSAELAPADAAPGLAARARRAIHPPEPLSVLPAGEIAISDPLFFRPSDEDPPRIATAAIAKMFGSLTLAENRVGIFWETYGVVPADTVEMRLRVSGDDKPGLLRRLGTAIGVTGAAAGEIVVSWREPRLGERDGLSWAGGIPIQGRGIVLDVSRLRPGRYRVEISVARAGAKTATSRRDVVIQR